MCWPFPKSSGSTSGDTANVISKSVCLIKEQLIVSQYHNNNGYTHEEKTQYSVVLVTKYTNGTTSQSSLSTHSTDEEMSNKMFDFYVKSKGESTIKEVLKETKIES